MLRALFSDLLLLCNDNNYYRVLTALLAPVPLHFTTIFGRGIEAWGVSGWEVRSQEAK